MPANANFIKHVQSTDKDDTEKKLDENSARH